MNTVQFDVSETFIVRIPNYLVIIQNINYQKNQKYLEMSFSNAYFSMIELILILKSARHR